MGGDCVRFLPYFRHECTLLPYLGRDAAGDPSYGPPVTIPARVEGHTRTIITRDGETITITTRIFTAHKIKPQDVIRFNGDDYVIQRASVCFALSGAVDHYEGLC